MSQPSAVVSTIEEPGYEVLKTPYIWARGLVSSIFTPSIPERSDSSNIHIVPFVGDSCVLIRSLEAGWDIPGGTLDQGEPFDSAVERELAEEIGARTLRYELFGSWRSKSSSPSPYRDYLPHPDFDVALGWADVELIASPTSDGGVLQETVLEIVILSPKSAYERLIREKLPHLAAVYKLAATARSYK